MTLARLRLRESPCLQVEGSWRTNSLIVARLTLRILGSFVATYYHDPPLGIVGERVLQRIGHLDARPYRASR